MPTARLLILGLALMGRGAGAQEPRLDPDWPPELQAALATYRAGDYAGTQRECLDLMTTARSTELRREATALHALASLRLPARTERIDGRAQLAQVAHEDPTLLRRAECLLALGIAQTSLGETAAALDSLDRAAQAFADHRQSDRLAEAYVALAEAWSRHNEWEVTPARFSVPRPSSPTEARVIRREQVSRIRMTVAKLGRGEEALARIDLIQALDHLATEGESERGLAMLARLAAVAPFSRAAADAALRLAEHHELNQSWAAALALYRRVAGAGLGDISTAAGQRAEDIARPQIELDVPASSAPGQPAPVALRVRNLDQVRLEVRRVDLAAWLESRRGRFVETQLPIDGAVQLARDLATHAAAPHAWWASDDLPEPLTLSASPGAYVMLAHAPDAAARSPAVKKLAVVTALHAVTVLGRERGLIWTTWLDDEGPAGHGLPPQPNPPARARFWMQGSFVPTRVPFENDVARFVLPAEARVLRDKRWVALVQAGEHLALCRGDLGDIDVQSGAASAVALVGGPVEPQAGESLTVCGLLLCRSVAARAAGTDAEIVLQALDALDQVRIAQPARIDATGAFSAQLPIPPELAGAKLRLVASRAGQVLENVRGRFSINVLPADPPPVVVTCDLPRWRSERPVEISGVIRAEYPWGMPLAGADVAVTLRSVRLAAGAPGADAQAALPFGDHGTLSADGSFRFACPVEALGLSPGPLALGTWVTITSLDGRSVQNAWETLFAPEPVHTWLAVEPVQPRCGDAVRFTVGWFDSARRIIGESPRLEIARDGRVLAQPTLYPSFDGLRSTAWRPDAPGTYDITATLATEDGAGLPVRRRLEVRPGDPHSSTSRPVQCAAHLSQDAGKTIVQVRLDGSYDRPLFVLVAGNEPLATTGVSALDGPVELTLPAIGEVPPGAQVLVAAVGASSLEWLAAAPVLPRAEHQISLKLEPEMLTTASGSTARLELVCPRGDPAVGEVSLILRLMDDAASGYVHWMPGEARELRPSTGSGLAVGASMDRAAGADAAASESRTGPPSAEPSADVLAALFEAPTVWAQHIQMQNERTAIAVPIPAQPSRYRLIALARTTDGVTARTSALIDARAGFDITVDVPRSLTVGDRTVAAIVVTNPRAEPATALVQLDPGGGLHMEDVRMDAGELKRFQAGGEALTLALPPGGRARVLAHVEAARPYAGEFDVGIGAGTARQRVSVPYRVEPARVDELPRATQPTFDLTLRRTVFLVTPVEAQGDEGPQLPAVGRAARRQWQRTPLAPGERVAAGQFLLVREQFRVDQPLDDLTWSQRAPATCYVALKNPDDVLRIGPTATVRLDSASYTARRLEPGEHTHEYFLVTVRPGTAALSPPDVQAHGRRLSVAVAPTETTISVPDSR